MRRGGMDRGDRMLFKGIDLSSAQRSQVDSIRSSFRNESKSLREQMAPAMKEARAARQSGDSAKIREVRQSTSASRDKMMALRKQEMAEIRGVLTHEQQSTFDKNVTEMQNRMRQGRGARKGARSGNTSS
jgi:Spy/CpxP family protein refolding chaperone